MHPLCLNCNRPLTDTDAFCPSCGQENKANRLKIGVFLVDFFSNYFAFDSKIARSTIPFLLKPGYLTNRYNEGKRASFVHPLRLYLIISFLFSLGLAFLVDKAVEDKKLFLFSENFKETRSAARSAKARANVAVPAFRVQVAGEEIMSTATAADSVDKTGTGDTLTHAQQNEELQFKDYLFDESLTDEEVIEKMKWEDKAPFSKIFVHQARKVMQKDMDVFLPYVMKNLSIMMFLLLPLFALYLFILFGRTEPYYICHTIHALHLHSFSFMIITLLILLQFFGNVLETYPMLVTWAFFLVTVYAFFSIKRVYKQGWLKTFFKFNVLGFFYFVTLSLGITLELLISFAMF
ncbi:MAG: DUF3667 domain-containing protein [Bacteroidetes bacterium]|nr:DUF3667 domain-containing protein [Bacteroidota bacterium]